MKIRAGRLVYFSPTGGTRAVIEAIADGTGVRTWTHHDLSLPGGGRNGLDHVAKDEALILAAPVYAGRIPATALKRFQGLRTQGSPVILVAVYGNRAFEDALVELAEVARDAGAIPVAGGAFIAEHSFSVPAAVIAGGRPDESDLGCAREFGRVVGERLRAVADPRDLRVPVLPGNSVMKERAVFPELAPTVDSGLCIACGRCAEVCPTAAITVEEVAASDPGRCILCCACVRACAVGARKLEGPFMDTVLPWLLENASGRKEPEVFVPEVARVADAVDL